MKVPRGSMYGTFFVCLFRFLQSDGRADVWWHRRDEAKHGWERDFVLLFWFDLLLLLFLGVSNVSIVYGEVL